MRRTTGVNVWRSLIALASAGLMVALAACPSESDDDEGDPPPTLENRVVAVNPDEADTSLGGVTLTLSRALGTSESVTVTYTLTAGGGASADDINEFSDLSGTKTLPAVTSGRTIRIPITATDDGDDDDNETIAVDITGVLFNDADGTDNTIAIDSLTPDPATLTIVDDDGLPTTPPTPLALENAVAVVNPDEADTSLGGVTLTLSRALGTSESVTVTYTLTAGSGASADDINEFSDLSGTKTLPAVTSGRTIRIPITATDDGDDDDNETIAVDITGVLFNDADGTDNTIAIDSLTPDPATLTIVDDDTTPLPTEVSTFEISSGTSPIAENGGSVTIRVTLNRAVVATTGLAIPYIIDGIEASDITAADLTSGAITVPAGMTQGAATIAAMQDTTDEGDETLLVTLGALPNNSAGARLTTAAGVTGIRVRITDDDVPTDRSTARLVALPPTTLINNGSDSSSFTLQIRNFTFSGSTNFLSAEIGVNFSVGAEGVQIGPTSARGIQTLTTANYTLGLDHSGGAGITTGPTGNSAFFLTRDSNEFRIEIPKALMDANVGTQPAAGSEDVVVTITVKPNLPEGQLGDTIFGFNRGNLLRDCLT